MTVTIKTSYQEHERLAENFDRDATWINEHRLELYEQYGDCVILVYHEQVVGHGAGLAEAIADAENNLRDTEGIVTSVVKYQSKPYRLRRINLTYKTGISALPIP